MNNQKQWQFSAEHVADLVRRLRELAVLEIRPAMEAADALEALGKELQAYREGGLTEEILRRNDGYIKVGRGCMIVALQGPILASPMMMNYIPSALEDWASDTDRAKAFARYTQCCAQLAAGEPGKLAAGEPGKLAAGEPGKRPRPE